MYIICTLYEISHSQQLLLVAKISIIHVLMYYHMGHVVANADPWLSMSFPSIFRIMAIMPMCSH